MGVFCCFVLFLFFEGFVVFLYLFCLFGGGGGFIVL